jgi:hypothetical protein
MRNFAQLTPVFTRRDFSRKNIIVIGHDRDTGRRGHDDALGTPELIHEPLEQRQSLDLITGVPMHLPPTGMPWRKIPRCAPAAPRPVLRLEWFEGIHVVIAGDKQRNSQIASDPRLVGQDSSIESIFP